MAVKMQDVLAVLEPDEPDYQAAAALGPEALPHLEELVRADDLMLASKATYAASLLEGNQGQHVIAVAAQHSDSTVRVAAAAAARNLPPSDASDVLMTLVGDDDPGVRKVARASVPDEASQALAERLESGQASRPGEEPGGLPPLDPAMIDAPMPGERDATGAAGRMPGEHAETGLMPGETRRPEGGGSGRMPGEQG